MVAQGDRYRAGDVFDARHLGGCPNFKKKAAGSRETETSYIAGMLLQESGASQRPFCCPTLPLQDLISYRASMHNELAASHWGSTHVRHVFVPCRRFRPPERLPSPVGTPWRHLASCCAFGFLAMGCRSAGLGGSQHGLRQQRA
jgi:hypothetical protein